MQWKVGTIVFAKYFFVARPNRTDDGDCQTCRHEDVEHINPPRLMAVAEVHQYRHADIAEDGHDRLEPGLDEVKLGNHENPDEQYDRLAEEEREDCEHRHADVLEPLASGLRDSAAVERTDGYHVEQVEENGGIARDEHEMRGDRIFRQEEPRAEQSCRADATEQRPAVANIGLVASVLELRHEDCRAQERDEDWR